jgi:hypothetical protein
MITIYLHNTKSNELLTLNVTNSENYKLSEEYRNALFKGAREIKLIKFFDLKIFEDEFNYSSNKTKFVRTKKLVIDSPNFIISKNLNLSNILIFKYFKNYIEGYSHGCYFEFVFACDVNYFNNKISVQIDQINEEFLFKNENIKVLETFNDFLEFNSNFYNKVWHLVKEHAECLSNIHLNNSTLQHK